MLCCAAAERYVHSRYGPFLDEKANSVTRERIFLAKFEFTISLATVAALSPPLFWRQYIGIELEQDYGDHALRRLAGVKLRRIFESMVLDPAEREKYADVIAIMAI
jgi:hypothetical protein